MSRKKIKQNCVIKDITSKIWRKQATCAKHLRQIYAFPSEEGLGQTAITSKFHNSSSTLIRNFKHQTQQ